MMENVDYLGHDDRIDQNSAIKDEEFAELRVSLLVNCVLNAIFSFIAAAGNGVILLVIWKTSSFSLLFSIFLHSRCHSSNRTQCYQTDRSGIYWHSYVH